MHRRNVIEVVRSSKEMEPLKPEDIETGDYVIITKIGGIDGTIMNASVPRKVLEVKEYGRIFHYHLGNVGDHAHDVYDDEDIMWYILIKGPQSKNPYKVVLGKKLLEIIQMQEKHEWYESPGP